MNVLEKARKLLQEGKAGEAVGYVEQAAGDGDEEALLTLATWRIFGAYGERDVGLAHRLLERGANYGSVEAARLQAYLVASGTGCEADPARGARLLEALADRDPVSRAQLAILAAMPPAGEPAGRSVELLSDDPCIRLVRGLLSEAECAHLRTSAAPYLQRSFVIDPRTGQQIPNPVRTSDGMNFGPTQEDLVVNAINRRVADVSSSDVGCGEPLHVLRYSPGQEYRPHMDALPGAANQRKTTVLIYLNADFAGGETSFPVIDLKVKGGAGDALVFRNVDEKGAADPRTRHAGLPVLSGSKWLATRWIRTLPFNPLEP